MSADRDDGGAAFPLAHEIQPEVGCARAIRANDGMSLRDYFAAKAMSGLLCLYVGEELRGDPDPDILAEHAFEIADAMLNARAELGRAVAAKTGEV